MEKRERNIRLVRDNQGRGDYSSNKMSGREKLEHKVSYQKKQKQRRMKKKRQRAALLFVFFSLTVVILLFMTPIFNIRSISAVGNDIVSEAEITDLLKPLVGQNLLKTGNAEIRKILKTIPYINTVETQKRLFPPSVEIVVTEYTPAALARTEGKTLILNSSLHVLSDSDDTLYYKLPILTGIEVRNCEVGEDIVLSHDEKTAALAEALRAIESTKMLDKIIEIDITNLTYITMNYDDRIDVYCGSSLDLGRKMRLLAEAVSSSTLTENSKGTIDLSETGKAVYTP